LKGAVKEMGVKFQMMKVQSFSKKIKKAGEPATGNTPALCNYHSIKALRGQQKKVRE